MAKCNVCKCSICGPEIISECPHNLPIKEMLEEVLSWRSDDFGYDCQALLEAESRALQDIGDKFLAALTELAELKSEREMIEPEKDGFIEEDIILLLKHQLTAEKAVSAKLVEALKFFRNNCYGSNTARIECEDIYEDILKECGE